MKQILVVDDDRNMHLIYEDIFSEKNDEYNLHFATDVEQAIEKLKATAFDLVILDIVMGPLSGQYLLLKLREDKKMKDPYIPVVIVSVLEKKELEFLNDIYGVRIFKKPLDSVMFMEAIGEITSGK